MTATVESNTTTISDARTTTSTVAKGRAAKKADATARAKNFDKMVARLSKLSVDKHFDAYEDIAWDDPDMAVSIDDDRLRLRSYDPMVHTDWYKSRTDREKSLIALYYTASNMKIGWQFENVLQAGLLKMARREPNGSTAFRYLHHEIIEESQHTLMFQELVNRSGLPVEGMPWFWRKFGPIATSIALAIDPSFFFVMVLGGEEPIDHTQRLALRDDDFHPLVHRIMQIHVTEEARHISFARHYMQREVPKMNRFRRFALSLHFPITMGIMTPLMLKPSPDMRRYVGLPTEVVDAAYKSEPGKALLEGSNAKVVKLATDLGLMNPVARRLWKAFGLWSEPTQNAAKVSA